MTDPISPEEFSDILAVRFGDILRGITDVAVGVSGGPDSVALLKLLSDWAVRNDGPQIHGLIVDHGLRAQSAQEADQVLKSLSASLSQAKPPSHSTPQLNAPSFPVSKTLHYVKLNILKWEGKRPETGVQERARRARYALMQDYCAAHNIAHLFLGHHQDDQAETFLFRLAKGSGLDGLSGMRAVQDYEGLIFLRPLLDIPKMRLIAICEAYDLAYIKDPLNESTAFARVRLRQSMNILEGEGLSVKRLSVTAARLARARLALEKIAEDALEDTILEKNTQQIVLNYELLKKHPEEIVLRVLLQCFDAFRPDSDYAPRMEKLEALVVDLMAPKAFRKRTLGGVIIARNDDEGRLVMSRET